MDITLWHISYNGEQEQTLLYTYYQQLTTLFLMFSLYAFRCLLCIIFRSFTYTRFPAHNKELTKHLDLFTFFTSALFHFFFLKIAIETLIKNYKLKLIHAVDAAEPSSTFDYIKCVWLSFSCISVCRLTMFLLVAPSLFLAI
jgi:hypothetical protein